MPFFNSQFDQAVEKATSEMNTTEDYQTIFEICDKIQVTPDGPKQAIRAISKRLNSNVPLHVMHALTLLDCCVKNCGRKFHLEVCSRDFESEIKKLLNKGKNASVCLIQDDDHHNLCCVILAAKPTSRRHSHENKVLKLFKILSLLLLYLLHQVFQDYPKDDGRCSPENFEDAADIHITGSQVSNNSLSPRILGFIVQITNSKQGWLPFQNTADHIKITFLAETWLEVHSAAF
ncbi:Signal transducing adapter molecule 1 [Araneus ventricosus]|uniref:Signal transducing adapter molecule 1 n=1 Tax=Araneus ventricosus TaxID=182803 RepID=A0A4Y2BWG1_ARAVE|nr:Signal transducing adapter molecule 1 [Araneus ventricosus]